MTAKVLNVKVTGVFNCILGDGEEFVDIDVTDPRIDVRYQNILQEMIDDLQGSNYQEIHLEKTLTAEFVHKVGKGNFSSDNNPNSYEAFATMTEWTHRLRRQTADE